jgi:FlaA1/EpsC-like NDP-sugar epimerase
MISGLNRRALQLLIDAMILALAFTAAYFIRFDGAPPPQYRLAAVLQLPYAVMISLIVLGFAGLHKTSWRYVSLADVPRIAVGIGISTAVLVAFRLGLPARYQFGRIPLGVIAAFVVLAGLGLLSARILRRVTSEITERRAFGVHRRKMKRVLLIGAGRAGVMVARELTNRPDIGLEAVGFIDDDQAKLGTYIHGIKVLGDVASLRDIVDDHNAEQAIISLANTSGEVIRRLHQACKAVPIDVKIIPGVYEILDGRVNMSRLRDVRIDDLLGRDPVELDRDGIAAYLADKRVLVTGAGGSIGSELCRQICAFGPAQMVLLEQAENPLFYIERELRDLWPEVEVVPVIADICDTKRLTAVFERCRPEVVFHAAAHKHVPMMESNPGEAIKNNSFGARKVVDAAVAVGCEVVVNISTDKAVNPTSVMGATKRIAEMYLQARAADVKTKLVAVRFGNVLGSAGSVIPIFRKQIEAGGPVTVTHPDMLRYFMTIPEACQLVMQTATMAGGGEIFVLDMGEPVKIVDLARDMIRLSGLQENRDVEIQFTGVRPGEKLYEELALDAEGVDKTRHAKIFIGRLEAHSMEYVQGIYDKLASVTDEQKPGAVRHLLGEVLPEFQMPAQEGSGAGDEIDPNRELMRGTPPLGSESPTLH